MVSIKGLNKNIPLKNLNFDPFSFISYKYSPRTLMLINGKKANIEENLRKSKMNSTILNNKNKKEYIYSTNTKKIKLKSLNKKRSCLQFLPKNEDILIIPSNRTTEEIINYNKSNAHNTLLNYYHKNNRNLLIINFVRNNSFDANYTTNTMNKSLSLNKSLYNKISKNEISGNQKSDSLNPKTNIKIKTNLEIPNLIPTSLKIKKINNNQINNSEKKVKIDYESEIFAKEMPHNLRFFSNHFFKKEKIKNNQKVGNANDFLSSRNNSNMNYQIIDFKGKSRLVVTNLTDKNKKPTLIIKNKNEDFHHIMKNPFVSYLNNIENFQKYNPLEYNDLTTKIQQLLLNPNMKARNNQLIINNKVNNESKSISYKEMKELSKKGFEKMEADKYRRFNLLVKNTNKEVIQLEKQLEKLLEENKKIFLGTKSDLNI